jgi:hypothetical protein
MQTIDRIDAGLCPETTPLPEWGPAEEQMFDWTVDAGHALVTHLADRGGFRLLTHAWTPAQKKGFLRQLRVLMGKLTTLEAEVTDACAPRGRGQDQRKGQG